MVISDSISDNGLRNTRKRQNIFHWLLNKRYDVCLQETHCSDNLLEMSGKRNGKGQVYGTME